MAFFELPFTPEEVPIEKIFEVDNTEFTYRLVYNELKDFYTLYVLNELAEILYTTKLVFEGDALHAGSSILGISSQIVPKRREDSDAVRLQLDTLNSEIAIVEVTAD